MNKKGFLDLGLIIFMGWGAIVGMVAVHHTTKDPKAKDLCTKEGKIQVGASLYECKRLQTLGEPPKMIVKECPKCPKPKVIKKPCGDDRKIFPMCEVTK